MRPKAPTYGGLRIRTKFARPARSLVERGVLPGPSCDGLWVARTGRGGSSTRRIACHVRRLGEHSARGDCRRKPGTTCRTRRLGSNRDIGARRRCLNGGVTSDALFQVDDVPMANPRLAGRHSGGAKVLLRRGGV